MAPFMEASLRLLFPALSREAEAFDPDRLTTPSGGAAVLTDFPLYSRLEWSEDLFAKFLRKDNQELVQDLLDSTRLLVWCVALPHNGSHLLG